MTIGDPGNANDTTTGYGGVAYIYFIGTYEVNLDQYTAFLNAVAQTDLSKHSAGSGAEKVSSPRWR